jgi:hypothetical protein
MAKKPEPADRAAEAVRKLTIVQLGLAGVPQLQIRKIVGGAIGEINAIVKLLRSAKRGNDAK